MAHQQCATSINRKKPFRWRVGYWLSDKKLKKMNFEEFSKIAQAADVDLVQIDLHSDLEIQGPYDAIFHKLSDFLVLSDHGDTEASLLIGKLETYLANHPEIVVFDPFSCVRRLCDRYQQYSLIQDVCKTDHVYTPSFVELVNKDETENTTKLKLAGVKYPFVCKPLVAHGTDYAHQMSIIFCEDGLANVDPPCVAQNFIRHNAVLYKVFVVGDRHFVVPRPSLKNFKAGPFPTIFFDSHEVSKEGCSSSLSQMDDCDSNLPQPELQHDKLAAVVRDIRRKTDISLFGLDVIVETETGFHFIIDVNNFPSYDGVKEFYGCLVELIVGAMRANERRLLSSRGGTCEPGLRASSAKWMSEHALADSGIGSCTESEDVSDSERKLFKALRIGQSASGGQTGKATVVDHTLKTCASSLPGHRGHGYLAARRLDEKFATISTPTAAFAEHLQPNWNRIKRFYGIPKPPSKPRLP